MDQKTKSELEDSALPLGETPRSVPEHQILHAKMALGKRCPWAQYSSLCMGSQLLSRLDFRTAAQQRIYT